MVVRAITTALIGGGGGGGEYSYIPILLVLKSVVIRVDFKTTLSGKTQIYEHSPAN